MSNKKTNEELQSRREFFKKAAKAALPIVGAVVLSQMPISMQATEKTGCDYTCKTSCNGDCYGHCHYGCKNTCSGTCSGSSKK